MILHIPFTASVRLRTLLLHLPGQGHPHRPGRLRLYANLPNAPDFADLEALTPIMDLDVSEPPVQRRDGAGRREVDEWSLKVQRMASVFSVTLLFVSGPKGLRCVVPLTPPDRGHNRRPLNGLLRRLQGRREAALNGHEQARDHPRRQCGRQARRRRRGKEGQLHDHPVVVACCIM